MNGHLGTNGHTTQDEESQDAADIAALAAAESSYAATSSAGAAAGRAPSVQADGEGSVAPQKRKMRITCESHAKHRQLCLCLRADKGEDNRYMEIMNICVLHLSDIERETGAGVDREELIQWYLEQKEMDFESEEDLEYEQELIAKALTKLAKVSDPFHRTCQKERY